MHTINITKIMKNITGSLFLLLSVFCLLSCSKDDSEELIEKRNYELSSIKWVLREGDGEEFFDIKTPEQVFRNTGNTTKEIVIDPEKEIYGTSQFYIDDKERINLPEEERIISIPNQVEILSSDYRYLVGGDKAPFQSEKSSIASTRTVESTYNLSPQCELRHKSIITMKKITATYSARFTEKEGLDSYEIEGKWEGTFIFKIESQATIDEIK